MCCVLLDLRNGFSFLQLSRFPMRLSEWVQNNSPGQDQPQSECQIASPLQGVAPGLARRRLSFLRMRWDHEPTPHPSQEGN